MHHRTIFGRVPEPVRVRRFRIAGSVLLLAALIAVSAALGWKVGLMAWIAMLSVSAFAVTQFLTYAPRFTLAPAGALLLSAVLAATLS
jgi:hypothetical protein